MSINRANVYSQSGISNSKYAVVKSKIFIKFAIHRNILNMHIIYNLEFIYIFIKEEIHYCTFHQILLR
jgi:hypothetical protein